MNLLSKARSGKEAAATARATAPSTAGAHLRLSNGLKDFLWLLSDVERGHLLDLGSVSQATVSFFTEKGFKVYTEDVLRTWKAHMSSEEERMRRAPAGTAAELDPTSLAQAFLAANLNYPDETFHAILAWDVFDYLEGELLPRVVSRLYSMLRPGGVMLAVFHSKLPEQFHRYCVVDEQTLELTPASSPVNPQRALQNRELLNLFSAFRSSKTFVGRDQLREGLFTK
ncbi:MAG: class I SAM-dependent methyltransferase [Acidobacteria bacterium]|nr:class I SAM-dependent methyltransferase [Acidobacteriota bacterium]MCL5287345.1 class I SAM-dependent methyltransferase [Acidobacteriota bacterium]